MIAELVAGCGHNFTNRGTFDRDRAFTSGFTNGRKQSHGGHDCDATESNGPLTVDPDRFGCRGKRTDSMTEILMVRHGQSEWNALGRWQGQADPPLSPLGMEQAEAGGTYMAKLHAEVAFDGIGSSTLDRAATTGDVIAQRLGFDTPFRTKNLAERGAGEWSGLTRAEIDVKYPGYLKNRKYPAGYEYDEELLPRIQQGLREVIENVPGDRLVVTAHGGIIYCIEAHVGLPFRHMANLGARWFDFGEDGTFTLGDRLELLVNFEGEATTPTQI